MAYRIHFTAQDLARTRVADAPLPFHELDLAVRALQDRSQPARLDHWRRRTGARLSAEARMVMSLIPPVGHSPSYLTPAMAGTSQEILEHVRSTPHTQIHAEISTLVAAQPVPSWARQLTDDASLHRRMCDGLDGLYSTLLAPYWESLTDLFVADRSVRARQLLGGGVESLLSQVNPRWMRWIPPVLEIRMPNRIEYDLFLHGQGVLLVPSGVSTRSLVDPTALPQPTVSYPAGGEREPLGRLTVFASGPAAPRTVPTAVSALLGRTRSAVLNIIAEHPGCSTKELAGLAGVAPASASEHATVLREAGLIRTTRHHNTALHSVTGLGLALLDAPSQAGT